MKNRDIYWRSYKIQKHCTWDNDAPVPFKVSTLGQLPSAAPSYLPESHWWSEKSSLSKVSLVFRKGRIHRVPSLGSKGEAESPGWLDVSPKIAWDVMCEWACCQDEAANHQLPIAEAFWIIYIVSVEEYSNLIQNSRQIHFFTHAVILNVMATQYICSLNGIYHPLWLVQWSRHCSCMCIPVLCLWLPGYTDTAQTFLIILTMAFFRTG